MTAVFSVTHVPGAGDVDLFCFEHHETLKSEPARGMLRTEEWCDYLAHALCDPREDDDPNLIRLMRRGSPPDGSIVAFEIFVTPVKTPFGIGFVMDYRQGRVSPPPVTEVAMEIYADIRKWAKCQNSEVERRLPEGDRRAFKLELLKWERVLYLGAIEYVKDEFIYPEGTDLLPGIAINKENSNELE